jgi:hypothetical protein
MTIRVAGQSFEMPRPAIVNCSPLPEKVKPSNDFSARPRATAFSGDAE